jgi:hypothetical protein
MDKENGTLLIVNKTLVIVILLNRTHATSVKWHKSPTVIHVIIPVGKHGHLETLLVGRVRCPGGV